MNIHQEIQDLKGRLDQAIKDNLADIKEAEAELELIMQLVDEHGHTEFFQSVAKDALEEARAIADEGEKLIKASRLLKIGG